MHQLHLKKDQPLLHMHTEYPAQHQWLYFICWQLNMLVQFWLRYIGTSLLCIISSNHRCPNLSVQIRKRRRRSRRRRRREEEIHTCCLENNTSLLLWISLMRACVSLTLQLLFLFLFRCFTCRKSSLAARRGTETPERHTHRERSRDEERQLGESKQGRGKGKGEVQVWRDKEKKQRRKEGMRREGQWKQGCKERQITGQSKGGTQSSDGEKCGCLL